MNAHSRTRATAITSFVLLVVAGGCPPPNPEPQPIDTDTVGTDETGTPDSTGTTGNEVCTLDGGCQPVLELGFSQVKQFDFTWAAVDGADYYQLLESVAPGEPFAPLGEDLVGESVSITMPLHFRFESSYVLLACNDAGCTESEVVDVMPSLTDAIGVLNSTTVGPLGSQFGGSVALSSDGRTLAVAAPSESSDATGIDGDGDDDAYYSGAVYVFVRNESDEWSRQAYVKASNTDLGDYFGWSVALSSDGSTLAVGAFQESSSATGVGGNQTSNAIPASGAAYVFVRNGLDEWSQQAYVKASNPDMEDHFGCSVALSSDGDTLAVGAYWESSSATGIGGNQDDDSAGLSGAVYVFVRDDIEQWSQQAYVKASNAGQGDAFGLSVALSGDGNTLAVGAYNEESSATGIDGDQANDAAPGAGAVYVFVRDPMDQWSQQAYVKASNTDEEDNFGYRVVLSEAGNTLAVGAYREASDATSIDGDQANESAPEAGAVYVFVRDEVEWSQQAYVKASNNAAYNHFGVSVTLSAGGDTLAIGASGEGSNATGIGGDQTNDSVPDAGAAYVFVRDGLEWSQQAYVKAADPDAAQYFGVTAALSGDANTLAVGRVGGVFEGGDGAMYLY